MHSHSYRPTTSTNITSQQSDKSEANMQTNAMNVFGVTELLENVLSYLDDYELVHALTQSTAFRDCIVGSPSLRERLPIADAPRPEWILAPAKELKEIASRSLGLYTVMCRNPHIADAVLPILSFNQREELFLQQEPAPNNWSQSWLRTQDSQEDYIGVLPPFLQWLPNTLLFSTNGPYFDGPEFGWNASFRLTSAPDIVYSLTWRSMWITEKHMQPFEILRSFDGEAGRAPVMYMTRRKLGKVMSSINFAGSNYAPPPMFRPFQLEQFLISHRVPFTMLVKDKTAADSLPPPTLSSIWSQDRSIAEPSRADLWCPAGTKLRNVVAWTEAWAQGAEGDLLGAASNGISEIAGQSDWLVERGWEMVRARYPNEGF